MLSPLERVNEALNYITLEPDEVLTDLVIDFLGDILGDMTIESVLRQPTGVIASLLTVGENQATEAEPNADVDKIASRLQVRLSKLCFGRAADSSQ